MALTVLVAAAPGRSTAQRPSARLDTAIFFAWWNAMASTPVDVGDTLRVHVPRGVRHSNVPFRRLRLLSAGAVPRPPGAGAQRLRPLRLTGRGASLVALWVPTDSLNRRDLSGDCASNRSWLGTSPFTRWTEVDLNPYCDETYGPKEIDFGLFWLPAENRPFIALTTNGPACVPAALYGYDHREQRYVRAREACAP